MAVMAVCAVLVVAFTALALLHGLVLVSAATWLSLKLPPHRPLRRAGPARALTAGRVVLAGALLVALPGFLGSVVDILQASG